MTYIAKPKFHHPALPKNALGYTHRDYEGTISTLCAGCGHDFDHRRRSSRPASSSSIEPHRVAKISGIGCSSKTPDYFLGNSHGFNSVHGRMPSVLTGANLANRDLIYLGVSGDGDSASIGLGQFAHAMRRGVNMVYIVENNGVYGLTKGQFSATADRGSKIEARRRPTTTTRSTSSAMALQLGATFVARSFSGDKAAAGAADQGGDRARGRRLHRRDLALRRLQQPRRLDQELRLRARAQRGGEPARLHHRPRADHGRLRARRGRGGRAARRLASSCCSKVAADYDAARPPRRHDLPAAARRQGPDRHRAALRRPASRRTCTRHLNTVDAPLNALSEKELCPGSAALDKINASLR